MEELKNEIEFKLQKGSKIELFRKLITYPLVPEYASESQMQKAVAIVALPFNSYLEGNQPDKSNQKIAEIVAEYITQYKIPFYGQREQGNILKKILPQELQDLIYIAKSEDGERVQSQRIIEWQAKQVEKLKKGGKVITIGMPEHLGRIVLLQDYFGLTGLISAKSKEIPYDESDRPGAQDWAKNRKRFSEYEKTVARVGTIVAILVSRI